MVNFRNKNYIGLLYVISQTANRDEMAAKCGVNKSKLTLKLTNLHQQGYVSDITAEDITVNAKLKTEVTELLNEYTPEQMMGMAKELFHSTGVSKKSKSKSSEDSEDTENNIELEPGITTTDEPVAAVIDKTAIESNKSYKPNRSLGGRYDGKAPDPAIVIEVNKPEDMKHVFKDENVKKRVDFLMELMNDNDPQDIKDDFRNLAVKLLRRAMR